MASSRLLITPEDLYSDDGYVAFDHIVEKIPRTFIFMVGARGIGKTYGAVEYIHTHKYKSIFMRRTQVQCDGISIPSLCQVKSYFNDHGLDFVVDALAKGMYGVYYAEKGDDGKLHAIGEPFIINCALSNVHNIRGFDASDFDLYVYDEFIDEVHARPIKGEGEALLNAYETMNRNRELQGRKPMKFIAMSNSNRLANPLFADLNMVTACDKQFNAGHVFYDNPERDMCVINFVNSPVSEAKEETALYKFAKGTDFSKMALDNEFRDYRMEYKTYNLKSLIPAVNVGEITIYRVKQKDKFFVSGHYMEAPNKYANDERGMKSFLKSTIAQGMYKIYLDGHIDFDGFNTEYLFRRYCGQNW